MKAFNFHWVFKFHSKVVFSVSSQDLMDDVYGREKRVKYYSMLSNIRHAARSSRGSRPGTMTPRSYYMSQRSLAPSQVGLPEQQSSQRVFLKNKSVFCAFFQSGGFFFPGKVFFVLFLFIKMCFFFAMMEKNYC